MTKSSSRVPQLRERLKDRPDLGRAVVIVQYWSAFPPGPLAELFDLIELELGLPVGLLRPSDSLESLLAPLEVRNPIKWLFEEGALEDGTSEINYQLKRRIGSRLHEPIRTVEDLVSIWCHAG